MSLTEIFLQATNKAQHQDFCHKKLLKLVENAFNESRIQELLEVFSRSLYKCYLSNDCADQNPYIARELEFLAKAVMKITLKCVQPIQITEPSGSVSQVYDITLDPFFNDVLKLSLKFACVEKMQVRFNTCYFIMNLLQSIGNNVEMDQSICNIIVDSLVDLLYDPKAHVRLQAIKALVRLQEPSNIDCVVLKSFLMLSADPNSDVRKAIINHIAAHPQSFLKLKMRLTDKDLSVRQAVYMKFAEINPKLCLKIVDRNLILTCGLADQNKKIQQMIKEQLIPKWLNYFEGNYLQFFRALRLDADENDINNFEELCSHILTIFLETHNLQDIVKFLPINKENKLIPCQHLQLESVFYWSGVIRHLRRIEDGEEYLETILPELTAFSNYIEKVIKEKSSVTMDEWENLEFQNIVYQLFKISSGFDMSDEVGRKTFYSLILQILTSYKFQQKVIDQILHVASLLNSNQDSLTINLCQIISEIREPLIEEAPSVDLLRKNNFEISKLKVKFHQLEIDEEEALKKKDFQHAHLVHIELEKIEKELDRLKNIKVVSDKVRVSKDDPETLCRCLDLLIGLLRIIKVDIVSPAMQSCRDEFLMPLLSNNSSEVHWRFILSLGLFSLMDKDLAFKHANFLCLPIATYRTIPNYDKLALKTSVACVTDLICVFGLQVIGLQESAELTQDSIQATSRRKLYSEDLNEPEVLNKDDITIEIIIDIILDMIDDEDEGVRIAASTSLRKLIVNNFPVSTELICRLILKWYNPNTEKKDPKLQQVLGSVIECFALNAKGAKKVVQKAIVPIISSIVNASVASPLLEIDIENVLRFLAALTNSSNSNEDQNIHNEIAENVIERVSNKPNDACTSYLVKLLTFMELNFDDIDKCKILLSSTELLLSDLVDKVSKKNLIKFRDHLIAGVQRATVTLETNETEEAPVNGLNSTHLPNGTEENIKTQSSPLRRSTVNGLSHGQSHNGTRDTDISEKDVNDNQKGNSSNSDDDNVESCSDHDCETIEKLSSVDKIIPEIKRRLLNLSEPSENSSVGHSEVTTDISETSDTDNESINSKSNNKDRVIFKKPRNLRKNVDKEKTGNVVVISEVILKKGGNKNSSMICSSRRKSQSVTRTRSSSSVGNSDSSSVGSPSRKLRKQQTSSNKVQTSSNIRKIKSLRTPSFPLKFKDYVTPPRIKPKTDAENSPNRSQVLKRTAETPLSITTCRRSKRSSKNPSFNESPTSSRDIIHTPFTKKNTNTPLSVGRRSSRRFSSSVTKVSKKKQPSLVVHIGRSLRTRNVRSCRNRTISVANTSKKYSEFNKKGHSSAVELQKEKTKSSEKVNSSDEASESSSQSKMTKRKGTRANLKNAKGENTKEKRTPETKRISNVEKEGNESIGQRILRQKGKIDNIIDKQNVSLKRNVQCAKENITNNLKKYNETVPMKAVVKETRNNTVKQKDNEITRIPSKLNIENKIRKHSRNPEDFKSSEKSDSTSRKLRNKKQDDETLKIKNKNSINTRQSMNNENERTKEIEMGTQRNKTKKLEDRSYSLSDFKSNSGRRKKEVCDINEERFKKSNSAFTKEKPNTGVLQNLNDLNNTALSTRSRRFMRSDNNSLSKSLTRSEMSERLNKSNVKSRQKLDFSASSDDTILKTFLQGDEFVLKDFSAENISSVSSFSSDGSKKENLSINASTFSSSSRRSTRRKRSQTDRSPSEPESKKRRTARKKSTHNNGH